MSKKKKRRYLETCDVYPIGDNLWLSMPFPMEMVLMKDANVLPSLLEGGFKLLSMMFVLPKNQMFYGYLTYLTDTGKVLRFVGGTKLYEDLKQDILQFTDFGSVAHEMILGVCPWLENDMKTHIRMEQHIRDAVVSIDDIPVSLKVIGTVDPDDKLNLVQEIIHTDAPEEALEDGKEDR